MAENLLFVESPLQLLNAYEAIYQFNLVNYEVIIRLSNEEINDKQIRYLVDFLNIENVEFVTINSRQKTLVDYMNLLIYKYKYKFSKKIEKIFIGNFDSRFFKLVMQQFKRNQIILLDDGSKTLDIQKQFSENYFYNLFTIYDITSIENQLIIKNEYTKLRTKLKKLNICKDKILFLGAKLSEIGIIDEHKYIKLLQKISDKHKEKKIIYVIHRGESKNKLQKIGDIKNITIKSYDFPIELLGLFEKSIPYKVVSFYSTAILTMKYLYRIEAECYSFDYSPSQYKESIDIVYDYYSRFIKVIDLHD